MTSSSSIPYSLRGQRTVHIEKTKQITPLNAFRYPVTCWEEMSSLLQERLLQIRHVVCEVFGWDDDIDLWLAGSQISGRSSSGKPDIDFAYFNPRIGEYNLQTMYQKCREIAQRLPFKIDGHPLRQPLPRTGKGTPGQRGAAIFVHWPDSRNNNDNDNDIYTPLEKGLSFPITRMEQLPSLVYRRIQQVYQILKEKSTILFSSYPNLNPDSPRLYLLGSQIHGRSKSLQGRKADIDLFLIWKSLAHLSPLVWKSFLQKVIQQLEFQVDITLQTTTQHFGSEVLFVPYEEKE